mmetsp:Transcript_17673/g.41597  ORF Transcript_17673/g.41597 Transcript_17673/m.41597 type:complete len:119 (+) Transcript_17673:759-1115(+)
MLSYFLRRSFVHVDPIDLMEDVTNMQQTTLLSRTTWSKVRHYQFILVIWFQNCTDATDSLGDWSIPGALSGTPQQRPDSVHGSKQGRGGKPHAAAWGLPPEGRVATAGPRNSSKQGNS